MFRNSKTEVQDQEVGSMPCKAIPQKKEYKSSRTGASYVFSSRKDSGQNGAEPTNTTCWRDRRSRYGSRESDRAPSACVALTFAAPTKEILSRTIVRQGAPTFGQSSALGMARHNNLSAIKFTTLTHFQVIVKTKVNELLGT
jgi:hypothetical protein